MKELLPTIKLYKSMLTIRVFEENVLELFTNGHLFGTTHAYIGQEANAVGIISCLSDEDIVVSNHRCHGHYIAHSDNPYSLLCEMMGKKDGLCSGRGGSQHICDGNFFSNGVQGGIVPLAAGLAYGNKFTNSKSIVTVFIGDGTLGEGVVYEVLNITSKWILPLLIVVENNKYAQSTKIEQTLAGTIQNRFSAFSIDTTEIDSFDVVEIHKLSSKIINKIKLTGKPHCLIINTYRFASHSKSDDGRKSEEIEKWKCNDPLIIAESMLNNEEIKQTRKEVNECIKNITKLALSCEFAQ